MKVDLEWYSPINYVDPDGQDARIGFQRDENITITLSSTISVRDYGADKRVGEYNK